MLKLRVLLISLFLSTATLAAQNNILKGIVKIQSSGSKPLAEVKISSFGAQTVRSNANGLFEITFSQKRPGMRVSLIVSKPGYEVINIEQVKSCLIRDNIEDKLVIVMAKEGERDKEALRHYNIMIEYDNEKSAQQELKLKAQIARKNIDDSKIANLKEQLYQLREDRNKWLRKAEELAPQMASIDLDRASDIVRRAYHLFNNGKIAEALQILEDNELNKNLELAIKSRDAAKNRLVDTKTNLDKCIESFVVKARFSIASREYEMARKAYMTAFTADSTNLERSQEILDFLQIINRQDLAIKILQSNLRHTKDIDAQWDLLNSLGSNLTSNRDYIMADSVFSQALLLGNSDQDISAEKKRQLMLETTRGKANLYLQSGNSKAADAMKKVLKNAQDLIGTDSVRYLPMLANAYSDLSIILMNNNQYKSANSTLAKAVDIGEKIVLNGGEDYQKKLALHLSKWGILLSNLRRPAEAEQALTRSLVIVKKLYAKNPIQYGPTLANNYLNMGNTFARNRQPERANTVYDTVALMYEKLAHENPNRFEDGLAIVKMNQGNILRDLKEFKKAEIAYLRSLEIRKRWYEKAKSRYSKFLSNTYQNMGLLYRRMGAYALSENAHLLSIQIAEESLDTYSKLNDPRLAVLRSDFGNLYLTTLNISKADSLYFLAASAYINQIKAGRSHFTYNLCTTLINNGELYSNGLQTYWEPAYRDRGLKILGKADSVLKELPDRIQDRFSPYLVNQRAALTKFSTEEIIVNGQLADVEIIIPDSSIFNTQPAIDAQLEWLKQIHFLRNDKSSMDTLRIAEANGFSLLTWIYLSQGKYSDAKRTAVKGLEIMPNSPELFSRLIISEAMGGRKPDTVKTGKDDRVHSPAFIKSYTRDLRKLEKIDKTLNIEKMLELVN